MTEVGMVVVGAGEAGARAATSLRERGFGGPITLIGDEPHAPYERPPLSKAVMTAATDAAAPPFVLDEAKLAAQAIDHVASVNVIGIDRDDRRVLLDDGRSLPYGKLLLATGAGPRRLSTHGATDGNVLYLRTFADALWVRARLRPRSRILIIGGGFIGLEIAASAVMRGCSVTVIEMAPRILIRGVPVEVAEKVAQAHRAAGVDLRTGVAIASIEADAEHTAVILADGTVLVGDAVVAGIGAVPRTQLAAASGLAVENGIKVDDRLHTDDPDIFAAGDCCSFPHPLYGGQRIRLEAWRNAQDQGAVAAANMLGADDVYDAVPWFWSDQYEDTLQVAGLTDHGTDLVERRLDGGGIFFHLDINGRLVAASGIGPNGAIAKEIRLAEMLIAKRATPDPVALADRKVSLKGLLRS